MTPEETASDIVSAFAVHNFNLGNGKLEAEPCDALRFAIAKAITAEREACAKIVEKLAGADAVYPRGIEMLIDAIRNR